MILKLLKKNNIQIIDNVEGWQEAVTVSLMPLVEQNYVEYNYIQGVIEKTKKYGSYYVLKQGIALVHGEKNSEVKTSQLAVTVLKNPVYFSSKKYPVRILIALVAVDSETHLEVINEMVKLFRNEEMVNKISFSDEIDEIYDCFLTVDQTTH